MKKLIVVSAAALATSVAVAGGMNSTYSAPAAVAAPATNLYVQAQLGYAQTYWKNHFGGVVTSSKHGNGGFTWGADLGYQFNKNMAVELGGFYLPKATVNSNTTKSWAGYAAVKLSAPVMSNVSVYAKVGLGYQHVKIDSAKTHHWGPAFGAGVDYDLGNNMFVNVQYMRFAGKVKNGVAEATNPNIWTAGIGYKFSM